MTVEWSLKHRPKDREPTELENRAYALLQEWGPNAQYEEWRITGHHFYVRALNYNIHSTFDDDNLTRLVLLAHKHRCRIQLGPCNMQCLELLVHPRLPEGGRSKRHPGPAELLAALKKMVDDESGVP